MNKIFTNSWFIQKFLPNDYIAIVIGPFVFTKYSKDELIDKDFLINHECTHARQWSELFTLSFIILFIMNEFSYKNWSNWYYLICPFIFYIFYYIEFLFKLIYYLIFGKMYNKLSYLSNTCKSISFEIESRFSEYDNNFLKNRNYFNFIKYIFKI